jgi:hypothetical protein
MVKNIEKYKPTFHKNERYSRKEIEKRMLQREGSNITIQRRVKNYSSRT